MKELVSKMTLEEKVGPMTQISIEAFLKTSNNYTFNSVMFPHQIAQAASFKPALAKRGVEITAYKTKASSTAWTFSPVLDLGRQPRRSHHLQFKR